MKKILIMLSVSASVLLTPTGCTKSASSALSEVPDIANFLVQASETFIANTPALIHIASSSLGNGTFNVNFSLSGNNSYSGSATLTMSGGSGTFTAPAAAFTSGGPTTLTVNSISNSGGASVNVTTGNTSSMFDSSGLMTATYTPAGGSAVAFRATQVYATLTGPLLSINGVMWTPSLTNIVLYNDIYSGTTGTVSFNAANLVSGSPTSTFNGSASYGVSGSSGVISDLSAYGSITISTTSPLLTGTFTYKNQDSSVVTGSFSCPNP